MRLFLMGVVAGAVLGGVVVGSTLPASATVGAFFVSVSQLATQNELFRNGYVAGVYDAVQVLGHNAARGTTITSTSMYAMADCLDRQGDTIRQFRIYADRALRQSSTPNFAAADTIMAACVR